MSKLAAGLALALTLAFIGNADAQNRSKNRKETPPAEANAERVGDIRWMIDTIGADRVMLGADLPSNVPVEYAKYKALDLAPEVYEKVLGGTAIDVFKLKW